MLKNASLEKEKHSHNGKIKLSFGIFIILNALYKVNVFYRQNKKT